MEEMPHHLIGGLTIFKIFIEGSPVFQLQYPRWCRISSIHSIISIIVMAIIYKTFLVDGIVSYRNQLYNYLYSYNIHYSLIHITQYHFHISPPSMVDLPIISLNPHGSRPMLSPQPHRLRALSALQPWQPPLRPRDPAVPQNLSAAGQNIQQILMHGTSC